MRAPRRRRSKATRSSTCRTATCRSSTRPTMRAARRPPVNVEAAPPPSSACTAAAADRGLGAAARTASSAAGARHRGAAGEAQARLVAALASRRAVLFGAAALPFRGTARANNFPNGPFRIIVPFGAGSATDQGARNVAEGLNRIFGVPAVVENKPGANGAIAAEVAAKARPDGQTIFVCSNTAAASNVAHDEVPALRPAQGLRAGDADRPRAGVHDRQSQGRGDDGAGVRGAVPASSRARSTSARAAPRRASRANC